MLSDNNWKEAEQQVMEMEKQSAKIGLIIPYKKIKILIVIDNSTFLLLRKKIKGVVYLRFPGELICRNPVE